MKKIRILRCVLSVFAVSLFVVLGTAITAHASGDTSFLNIHAIYLTTEEGNDADGDAILLESNGHFLLMDTAIGIYPYMESGYENNISSKCLMNYLDTQGVKDLDIYISHMHVDHYGGFQAIIESGKYNIGTMYLPAKEIGNAVVNRSSVYTRAEKLATEKGFNIVYLAPKSVTAAGSVSSFTFGKSSVNILGPVSIYKTSSTAKDIQEDYENNNSLCAMVSCGSSKYLTMGDAQCFSEDDMVKTYGSSLKADILKLNHHGYLVDGTGETVSNQESFIDAVQPKYAYAQGNTVSAYLAVRIQKAVAKYGAAYDVTHSKQSMVFQLTGDGNVAVGTCSDGASYKKCTYTKIDDVYYHNMTVVCTACGEKYTTTERHNFDANNYCKTCGYCKKHNWNVSTGSCNYCGEKCIHSWDATRGRCSICKIPYDPKLDTAPVGQRLIDLCTHKWDYTTGKCKLCTSKCKHTWNSKTGKCKTCKYTHKHKWNSKKGKCKTCKYKCKHKWNSKTGKCKTCKYKCKHKKTKVVKGRKKCKTCRKKLKK